jgi:biotin synthase-related radical SAM superfamily protein
MSGTPYTGNAVLQGLDWVAFQCLWSCEYASEGLPCQYCFSGAAFQTLAEKGKPQPEALAPEDVAEIAAYAFAHTGVNSIQITGGSTFSGKTEAKYIHAYLHAIQARITNIKDLLLYITPPEDERLIDEYFALGASRIACSLEVWNMELAKVITPGKIKFTTRERHLKALSRIVEKYGIGKAFSNFIIGLEPFESLAEGALYLAERGIAPTASVWMPMGRPVCGSMKAPDIDYYRRVIDLYAELYIKYRLKPPGERGLHVCVDRDIWRATGNQ